MRDLMTGLTRPMLRLLGRDDRGAVGVLVAVLIGGGVLLGMGAMAVDVGQIYSERAQLQNGADGGALGVAKTCAVGSCNTAVAQYYANHNSNDGTSAVDLVCGLGTGLGACPPSSGKIYDCPPPPAGGKNFVDVHTSTLTPSGSTLLPPSFARTLLGMSSYPGTTVKACAQAEWGAPSWANTIALTISACEWDTATNNGTDFAPPPPAIPPSKYDQSILLHTGSTSGSCPANPADADAPGAFGWVDGSPAGSCSVTIVNNQYSSNTGVSGNNCSTAIYQAWLNHTVVYIPVYSSVVVDTTGTNVTYNLKGFAAFVITGYRIPAVSPPKEADWLNSSLLCSSPNVCIDGYFTQALIPDAGGGGSQDLGANVVTLSG